MLPSLTMLESLFTTRQPPVSTIEAICSVIYRGFPNSKHTHTQPKALPRIHASQAPTIRASRLQAAWRSLGGDDKAFSAKSPRYALHSRRPKTRRPPLLGQLLLVDCMVTYYCTVHRAPRRLLNTCTDMECQVTGSNVLLSSLAGASERDLFGRLSD